MTAAALVPPPTARGRAPQPALEADENAHAQRPWSAADREAAHTDLARWTAMFAPRRPRCSCGWPFDDESLHLHAEPAR